LSIPSKVCNLKVPSQISPAEIVLFIIW
jgi:hypothetical protein